jgi:beta-glucosidase/6-phospho-beta-glucosidase/beta-galactosidase
MMIVLIRFGVAWAKIFPQKKNKDMATRKDAFKKEKNRGDLLHVNI